MILILLGILCLTLLYVVFSKKKTKVAGQQPPLPPCLPSSHPLLGDLPTLRAGGPHFSSTLATIAATLGPVFRLRLLHKELVVLSGEEVIRTALHNPSLDRRPNQPVINLVFCGSDQARGIVFNSGRDWTSLRRFTMKTLKDFGFGRSSMEDRILEEFKDVEECFGHNADTGEALQVDKVFNMATLNVVWSVVAGRRYSYDNGGIENLLTLLNYFISFTASLSKGPLLLLPWLRHLPPWRKEFTLAKEKMDQVREFLTATIEEHRDSLEHDQPRDVIDAFLIEAETTGHPSFTQEQTLACAMDLFTGGTETASKSLQYLLAFMVLHPQLQEQVHRELLEAAPGRQVRLSDQPQTPLTLAVMAEAWRLHPTIPLAPTRLVEDDITIGGFLLPAGAKVMINIAAAHRDPGVWDRPQEFLPRRHLVGWQAREGAEDGEALEAVARGEERKLLTFGTGRRRCIGEGLARAETYLLFSNLLHQFRVAGVLGAPPCLEGDPGITLGPMVYSVMVARRGVPVPKAKGLVSAQEKKRQLRPNQGRGRKRSDS